jgi:hypothetical protein
MPTSNSNQHQNNLKAMTTLYPQAQGAATQTRTAAAHNKRVQHAQPFMVHCTATSIPGFNPGLLTVLPLLNDWPQPASNALQAWAILMQTSSASIAAPFHKMYFV